MIPEKLQQQFMNVLEENKKIIYKICTIYCDHIEDKKDLFSEIVVQLWKSYPHFHGNSKISTWIYKVSLNTALNHLRLLTKKSKFTLFSINKSPHVALYPEEDFEYNEQIRTLKQCIEKLNDIDKAIILLYLDEYSYKDIAQVIGMTKTNVATKINRIKIKLKKLIYDHFDEKKI